MTPREYWQTLRSSWPMIFISTLVGSLLALGMSAVTTPTYEATSQLFATVRAGEELLSGGTFVQQRVRSYVEVLYSPDVLEPVIESLGLDTTTDELANSVSANSPTGTVLLNITATDTSAQRAADISNATAKSLAREIVRLETTQAGTQPVKVELIRPALVPSDPVSPKTLLNILLGALLGLLAGVTISIVRQLMDTTIKSAADLEEASEAVPLGVISFDREASKMPLVTLRGTPRAESYRTIRTNLQYVDIENPPRSVVITSSVPQEGKSTTACNLAIALAQGGTKVLLLEADLRRPKIAEYLGVDGSVGLTDVLIGRETVDRAIISWQRGLLDFLPSGAIPPNPSELLGSRQMTELLEELTRRYDIVLLDAPPLLPVTDAAILTTATDGAILVTRHGVTRREQVEEASESLRQVNARVLGTVLNFAPRRRPSEVGYAYGYGSVAEDHAEHKANVAGEAK
ncbi:MAG: polysaccharide biosynthesis tyrosine autokinase [Candidatus Nanopelagicales bacterium]